MFFFLFDVVGKLTLMSFDLRKNTLQQLQGLSVVLCLHFYQLHSQSETQQRVRGVCTSMQEFTHGTQKRHLLSGSSLHSRFLWPQNCTCLLTADPSERSKRILSGFMKKLQLLFVLKLVFMSRQQILIYNIINNLHIITLLQITSLKTHFNKKSCFFVFLTLWYFCHDERRI